MWPYRSVRGYNVTCITVLVHLCSLLTRLSVLTADTILSDEECEVIVNEKKNAFMLRGVDKVKVKKIIR